MFKRLSLTAVVAAVAATVIACGAPQQAPAPPPPTPEPVVEEAPPPPPIDPLLQRCQDRIAAAKVQREAIVAKPGLQQTLDAYNTLQIELGNAEAESSLMRAVHPEATVRDAASECEQRVAAVMTELSLDRPLYEAFAALDMTGQAADAQRLVTKTLEDFKRAGVDKDDATRARIKALNEQLVDVGQKFDKAITSDVRSIEVEPTRLKGLPQDWIDAHKPGENGKVKVTTNYPDYIPFMSYAEDDAARKELYVVYRQRAWPENGEHLKKILEIRYELATILGFPNWAAYITANKMIQNDKNAADFIARISKAAGPRSKRDLGVLLAALKTTDKAAKVVEDWQQAYLSNVVKKAKYAFDPQELRPYFHFDKVKSGLLDLTSKLFGIRYVENKDTARWHPDVSVFDVFEGEKAIGTIYLDMHPRENKYKHAAQFTLTNGVAGKQLPAGVLVCNFPNPRTGNGLMEYKDVETFFHEFGHLLHHVLGGGQRYSRFSGVATEWDFVEAPSQIFEEWASDYTTLAAFAKNDKGEAVPKALVKKLRDSEEFGKGLWVRHQMFYASLSLAMHDRDPKDLNLDQLAEQQMAAHSPYPFVPDTHMQASFGHLNGYSAIYYTYMWSMVIAKDLFSAFEKAGIHDVATSMKYRKAILDPGGSKDAADLVQDFLGRKYDFKAFEKWLNR